MLVGLLLEPERFLQQAMLAKHPYDMPTAIPEIIKHSIAEILNRGPSGITRHRLDQLRILSSRAKELANSEAALHASLDAPTQKVLEGKNLLLLKEVLQKLDYQDTSLVDDILRGCDMHGVTPSSRGAFPKRPRVAQSTASQVRQQAKWRGPVTLSEMRKSFQQEQATVIWDACVDEKERGWVQGPYTRQQVDVLHPDGWLLTKRFAIKQNDKYRIIDDCLDSSGNDALTSTEKLDLHDVDTLAAVLRTAMEVSHSSGPSHIPLLDGEALRVEPHSDWRSPVQWQGRCLDLKSAYKQLPLSPGSRWMAVLAVLHPSTREPTYFQSVALLFGSTASVYMFNRFPRAIWFVACKLLFLVTTCFVDDFPCLEPQETAREALLAFQALLRILGVRFAESGPKCPSFASTFASLGVQFDLSAIIQGSFDIANKPSRVEAIGAECNAILARGSISRSDAATLHGRLQFSSTQILAGLASPFFATWRTLRMARFCQAPSRT
jgi:hypothetical protein